MPSFFSVIRYVPDPIADESINVGVAVYSGSTVHLRFTKDWARAHRLAGRAPIAVRNFIADITSQQDQGKLSEQVIRRYCESWHNQIQWTEPRASLKHASELVDLIAAMYLRVPKTTAARRPGKRRAIRIAIDSLTTQLKKKFDASKNRARELIRTEYEMAGRLEEHALDLAIVNGAVKAGAFALSFAVTNRQQLKRDIDATAFAVEDVLKANRRLPISVLAYADERDSAEMKKAGRLFNHLDAAFIPDSRIPNWSKELVDSLPISILGDE